MRVAWVTPHLPTPIGGGGAAHEFELIRQAARDHDIHLISSDLAAGTAAFELGEGAIPAEGVAWRAHQGARTSLEFAAHVALAWPTAQAWGQRDRIRALRDALARHLERRPVDLVHLTFGEIAPVAQGLPVPVTLLLLDVMSRQMRREAELAGSRPGRLACGVEARKIERWERRWLGRVEGLACVSPIDREVLDPALHRDIRVIPNPVPDDFFASPAVSRSRATVVLVANLSYRPNIDAVTWLTGEIWPRVTRRRPDARLQVVGHQPHRQVVEDVASVGGELHANVEDARPFYWGAAVAVAPIRLGSGVRNKVLHAMACGAPVVATATSLEGIPARPLEHVLVADRAAEFADAVVAVLDDPPAAQARAGRAYALLDQYRTTRVMERFGAWWEETARRRAPGPASPARGAVRASVAEPG